MFTKLAAYAAQSPERLNVEATSLLVASAIHFVVHLAWSSRRGPGGVLGPGDRRRRRPADRLQRGLAARPGPAAPCPAPGCATTPLDELAAAGLDPALACPRDGMVSHAVTAASSPLLPVAVLCGPGAGPGLWLAITALLRRRPRRPAGREPGGGVVVPASRRQPPAALARRAGLALAAAVIAGLATGWPAGTVLAGLAAWSAPSVLGRDQDAAGPVARIEAIAGWTEMLRDTTSAAAGLEQAIAATAPLAPEAIRPQVTALAGRLAAGTGWTRRCASSPARSPTRSPTWSSPR